MRQISLVAILFVGICCYVNAQTVQNVLDDARCSTAVINKLSTQLAEAMETPVTIISGITGIRLGPAARAVPYLQSTALDAIRSALEANPGKTLTINSALRTFGQQVLLFEWFKQGKCDSGKVATPGRSPHESGLAIDTNNYDEWKDHLEAAGCKWYGKGDKVHFTCPGRAYPGDSIRAFQKLWNCNNPDDKIAVDGKYGEVTREKILSSPIGGFEKTC